MRAHWSLAGMAVLLLAGISTCSDIQHAPAGLSSVVSGSAEPKTIRMPDFNAWIEGLTVDQDAIDEGKAIALGRFNCEGCHHGTNPQAAKPMLYGMPAQYTYKQLLDYAAGNRRDKGSMEKLSRNLTDREKKAVSVYYALTGMPDQDLEQHDAALPGREIVYNGSSAKPVPACINCHGLDSRGVAPWVPPLAGQNTDYLINRLLAWKTDAGNNDRSGEMSTIAQRMSEEEIRAVSRHLGSEGR